MPYTAPVEDIKFAMRSIADLDAAIASGDLGDLDGDLVDAVLEEAGRFASEVVAPLNRIGDEKGASVSDGVVTMPDEWKGVYERWVEAGWGALAGPESHGGQALPTLVSVAVSELWNSAALAFALNPLLTAGAVEAMVAHGSPELQAIYLEKLVSGAWTGTMNLTEPQAGSDLNALRSRAERRDDGTYRIFGQKIFITYGEHELTENIVHMVLARLPDAPPGTRGISLFLVPKYIPDADGNPGVRNDVFCHSVEEKLGIHASPTCTMIYGDGKFGDEPGAVGWLIGEENRGLACMFTMMNNARLNVAIQGVAVAERAFQHALAYAHERRQGAAPGHDKGTMAPIVAHPDIRRDLMAMKAMTGAARALCLMTARAIDLSHRAGGEATREKAGRLAGFLTPLAKGYATDSAVEVASMGIQVHGGMGFIEETGAAQYLRDARILPIYEGTNGIQAIDFVTRKLPVGDGETARELIAEFRDIADALKATNAPEFGNSAARLSEAIDAAERASAWMLEAIKTDPTTALAGDTAFQRLFAMTAGGAWLAKGALARSKSGENDAPGRIAVARFYCEQKLTDVPGLATAVTEGAGAVLDTDGVLAG